METIRKVKKRDGQIVPFDKEKIRIAIKKVFLANNFDNNRIFVKLTEDTVNILEARLGSTIPQVEDIQDIVEEVLIKNNYNMIAKSYIIYRHKHKELRVEKQLTEIKEHRLKIRTSADKLETFKPEIIKEQINLLSSGLKISTDEIIDEVCKNVYNNITEEELQRLIENSIKLKIEEHYDYSYLASRYIVNNLYEKILSTSSGSKSLSHAYKAHFSDYIKRGITRKLLNNELENFDIKKISDAIKPERDLLFQFLGMQTLCDRYLLRDRDEKKEIFELPQWMWMRVAMGLALKEKEKEERAIEFYDVLSNMHAVCSTPTLFNSGTTHSQMSSCYVNTVDDSLKGIFKTFSDCAQLSKWAGGIGTDWTNIRAKSSTIEGTNGISQGIVPFIKIFNDIALAVNQGGKRKGAMAAYLEVWHKDIEEFFDLKKNTGDERRRAHDIHTACCIPDLFMKRVKEKKRWTLFSPDETRDLYNSYGKEFERRYEEYEKKKLPNAKAVDATELWRKLLTRLYETGHPWIIFKDSINIRNPQDHTGMIHTSNLCTEITLNTSTEETAVCNLASINLSKMIKDDKLDENLLQRTIDVVVRMLDNVIDNNFYPIPEAEISNSRHRPIGLGVMGYQDALYKLKIDFDSEENLDFADYSMEMISYHAIMASSKLAKERGTYKTYKGSKWEKGLTPYDTLELLEKERGSRLLLDKRRQLDWDKVKDHIRKYGMRNSNCLALAPTATISNITGTTPTVEPTYKNIYMKENLSGNFIIINRYLIDELEKIGLWNKDILNKIKLDNGSILNIDEIPADLRRRFKETFEIEPSWIVKAAALRAKWIDQSASTNIFLKTTSGKVINDIYMLAWESGLKTTYYLRTLAASQVTKTISSSIDKIKDGLNEEIKLCSIENPDCESCQ